MEKKKMLVLFIHNHIGGAMTALVNFVNALDTNRYDVDLLFFEIRGKVEGFKPEINILPPAGSEGHAATKLLNPRYLTAFVHSQYLRKVKKNKLLAVQRLSQEGCTYSRRLETHYDLAVAFELNWPFYYMMRYVNAEKKLVWLHNDYHEIGYHLPWDRKYFDKVDRMVFVSSQCRDKFAAAHPEYGEKSCVMPNLMSRQTLRDRAEQTVTIPFTPVQDGVNFVSIARVQFVTKGLDRVIPVMTRLRDEGLLDRFRWMVIGAGRDSEALQKMIAENGLENHAFLIGMQENPMPYLKYFDALLQPSRNEGKPVVVTEAQIMGLVPVVTHYASATEQVESGVDGFIFENNDEALYQGIRDLVLHPEKLAQAKKVLDSRKYTNEEQISCFYEIVESL